MLSSESAVRHSWADGMVSGIGLHTRPSSRCRRLSSTAVGGC